MKISEKDNKELTKARYRIGSNTTDAMHWLVRFAQTPLEELSEGDFKNLSLELYVFTIGAWAQERRAVIIGASRQIPLAKYDPEYALDTDEVRTFQGAVRDCLDKFLELGHVKFQFHDFGLSVHPNETRTATLMFPSLNTLRDGFRYHFACLPGEHAHRIGRCIECSSLFVAIRGQQKFCTPRCRSRAGTREFRKAHSKRMLRGSPAESELTTRQRQVLQFLTMGHTVKESSFIKAKSWSSSIFVPLPNWSKRERRSKSD